eukprot:scaffold2580_cov388-Prasinococcus_capsulatus_cf.AAC.2
MRNARRLPGYLLRQLPRGDEDQRAYTRGPTLLLYTSGSRKKVAICLATAGLRQGDQVTLGLQARQPAESLHRRWLVIPRG